MEWISRCLFESPFQVYLGLVVIELGLIAWWWENRTPRRALLLLIGPVLAGAVTLSAALVQTDREQVHAAAAALAKGIEDNRTEPLEEYLDDNFIGTYQGRQLTKPMAIVTSNAAKKAHKIGSIRITRVETVIRGKQADMVVTTAMSMTDSMFGSFQGTIKFSLRWIKLKDCWRLIKAGEPEMLRY